MSRMLLPLWIVALATLAAGPALGQTYIDREKAAEHPDFVVQGEYAGEVDHHEGGADRVALQIRADGDGAFTALAYHGGLPGDGWNGRDPLTAEAERDDQGRVTFTFGPYTAEWEDETVAVTHEEDGDIGSLEKVLRESPEAGMEPPEGAIVLFDGESVDMFRDGARMTDEGLLMEGAVSKTEFEDATIHLEFLPAFMADASNQARSNSGVYIQQRYEIQILDSFGQEPVINGCGALYQERTPDLNMSYPPLQWQTYTIEFTAPRFDDEGEKTANARFTVRHNGVVIHDDVELPHGTGAGKSRGEGGPGPLLLQDHSDPVRFRNVWIDKH